MLQRWNLHNLCTILYRNIEICTILWRNVDIYIIFAQCCVTTLQSAQIVHNFVLQRWICTICEQFCVATLKSSHFMHNFLSQRWNLHNLCTVLWRNVDNCIIVAQFLSRNIEICTILCCNVEICTLNDSLALANTEGQLCLKCTKIQECNFHVWKALRISFLPILAAAKRVKQKWKGAWILKYFFNTWSGFYSDTEEEEHSNKLW